MLSAAQHLLINASREAVCASSESGEKTRIVMSELQYLNWSWAMIRCKLE